MKLIFLPTNQAWAFVLGDVLTSMDSQFIFNSRADAVDAARRCGLSVNAKGVLS
jgi:hypothetical protein